MKKVLVFTLLLVCCSSIGYAQEVIHQKTVNTADHKEGSAVIQYRTDAVFISYVNVDGNSNVAENEVRALANFQVNYPVFSSAKLHIVVRASEYTSGSSQYNNQPFSVSKKDLTTSGFNINDFSIDFSNVKLIENFPTGALGTGVTKNTVSSPPAFQYDTEYVIDVTDWYNDAIDNSIDYLGFLFYFPGGVYPTDSTVAIWANNGVTKDYDDYSPWLEIKRPTGTQIPEPFSIILVGLALSSIGVYKKLKK